MKAHTFESYRDKYENLRMKREDGILEVALNTRGGPLVFNGYVHEALVRAFRDIGDDRDNHVVILTGTGDEFCAQLSPEGFDFFTPTGYDKILREGVKILENILDIQVPMIAAISGAATAHSEYALLCDIVIVAEGAYFQDAPHPALRNGAVMTRNKYLVMMRSVLATAILGGMSAVAGADDSSMSRLTGDSYVYINATRSDASVVPAWRLSHPNGLTQSELQARVNGVWAQGAHEPVF